jgi:hypothetical protein
VIFVEDASPRLELPILSEKLLLKMFQAWISLASARVEENRIVISQLERAGVRATVTTIASHANAYPYLYGPGPGVRRGSSTG